MSQPRQGLRRGSPSAGSAAARVRRPPREGIANAVDTGSVSTSGTKELTALSIMSLIEEGSTSIRDKLGAGRGPAADPRRRRSSTCWPTLGIGYFEDGESMTDYVSILCTGWRRPWTTSPSWMGMRAVPPGERFAYNNGGFVVLALIGERAGCPSQLVGQLANGDMGHQFRAGERVGAALGYLDGDACGPTSCICRSVAAGRRRYSTAASSTGLPCMPAGSCRWTVGGHGAPQERVPSESMRHGLGFWRTRRVMR